MNWPFQPALLSAKAYAGLWSLVLIAPTVGWLFAAVAVGPGRSSRFRRAAISVGWASVATLALVLLTRIVELIRDDMSGGPLGWLQALAPLPSGWFPVDAIVLLALAHAAVFVLSSAVAGYFERGRTAELKIPLPNWLGIGLGLLVAVALYYAKAPYSAQWGSPVALDLAAVMPLVCAGLAVWTRSERLPPEQAAVLETSAVRGPARIDVEAVWRKLGAISTPAPLVTAPAAPVALAAPSWAAEAWACTGAEGPPPKALEDITQSWAVDPGNAALVGDLPDPTERHFVVASLVLAIRRMGLPSLVLTTEPKALRDEVEEALRRSGTWSCGPLAVGEKEMRQAFAGNRAPAAVFIDAADLSDKGLRALGGARGEAGALFCRGLGLVALPRVDRGAPIELTNRLFTLRRLWLRLRAAGARPSILATGFGGAGSRSLVEQAFPGASVREVPLAPRATAPLRAWRVAEPFRLDKRSPWPRRALEEIAGLGLPVAVGDPCGVFDRRAVEGTAASLRFARDVALDGKASASALDEAWLVAAYRAMGNRIPLPEGGMHEALWSVPSNPVTSFLTRPVQKGSAIGLVALSQVGQLPPPRPLFGANNRMLARAHLSAALREGDQDVDALGGLFGKSLVDQALGEQFRAERHALRSLPGKDGLVRTALASVPPGEAPSPMRRTVTERVVAIVDENGGRLVEEADQATVQTRFYPGRVFAVGEERFEVPLNAYDEKRQEIRVRRAEAGKPLTRPKLSIQFESAMVAESVQAISRDRCNYQVAAFDVTVAEAVGGCRQRDGGEERSYAPVVSRYRTKVRGLFFPTPATPAALHHLARSVDGVLVAHLLAAEEDVEVVPVGANFQPGLPPGLIFVDRYVDGMGVAEALDHAVLGEVLLWSRAVLAGCACGPGCKECTPPEVLAAGPDKSGVLRLLGA